jgi:xylan 1,4-beta-xylosidase
MAHLCGRPLRNRGRCTLGRETAIQRMEWCNDGWLRTAHGEGVPRMEVPPPALASHPFPPRQEREDFDGPDLPIDFQWLRSPWPEELFSLTERPGWLRLFGRETPGSLFRQAMVARRQQSHCFTAETSVEFAPEHYQQMAGLICYYNSFKYHYLAMSYDEQAGRHLRVISCQPDQVQTDVATEPIAIPQDGPVELRVDVDYERLYFSYRAGGSDWHRLPPQFDASILSDEAGPPGNPNFTGAFVGICCQDLAGTRRPADFDWFEYRERAYSIA